MLSIPQGRYTPSPAPSVSGVLEHGMTTRNAEIVLKETDLIVSKTDLGGYITYANRTFMRVSGYRLPDLLGEPHNIVRHPDMPRGIFLHLWQTIQSGRECFAFVKNQAADGAFYWVRANVTPDVDSHGTVRGYHSARRKPNPEVLRSTIIPLYQEMRRVEAPLPAAQAAEVSLTFLKDKMAAQGTDYENFILTLT